VIAIDWPAFVTVVVASLLAACGIVVVFSLALRLGDGAAPWRRNVSFALYAVCGLMVAFGIYLIVPAFH
jgi:hypothetical protein